jgi:hypothetical protein
MVFTVNCQRFLSFQVANCASEAEAKSSPCNPQPAFRNPQLEGSILPVTGALFNHMRAARKAGSRICPALPGLPPAASQSRRTGCRKNDYQVVFLLTDSLLGILQIYSVRRVL